MRRIHRTAAAAAVLAVCLITGVALCPDAAWADDRLAGVTPRDGAVLASAPTEVDLTFTGVPDPELSHAGVWDAAGNQVRSGTLARSGHGLRLPVTVTATGNYTIAYHIVFTDGEELLGLASFSVGTGIAPPVPDAAVRRAAEAAVSQHVHGVDSIGGTLLLLDVVVLVGVGVALLRRPVPRHTREVLDARVDEQLDE